MAVLQTRDLTKRYGGKPAVDKVSIKVDEGDVFGLIGLNGAGKTTLMRMVTSLAFPSEGEVELFGERTREGLAKARKRLGSVVETPAFYPNLSAKENLEYYRIQRGIPDKGVVEKSLEMVSLTDTDKKKFKNFSLGMKQRLGLALVILSGPDFIMLDEPTNGLDPNGIIEMRDMVRRLQGEGVTFLISSHILTELSHIATKYAIIHQGRLVKSVTSEKLKEECKRSLAVTVDDVAKASVILETKMDVRDYKQVDDRELRVYQYLDNPSEVTYQLVHGGVRVHSLVETGDNLEDYFTKTIQEVG